MPKIETPEEFARSILMNDPAITGLTMAIASRDAQIRQERASQWHNAKTNPPLPGKEVIAWSVIMRDSLIAWVSMLDGKWYEGNFSTDSISGIEWWTEKPEPPAIIGKEGEMK